MAHVAGSQVSISRDAWLDKSRNLGRCKYSRIHELKRVIFQHKTAAFLGKISIGNKA
jgi:hypothetical protein